MYFNSINTIIKNAIVITTTSTANGSLIITISPTIIVDTAILIAIIPKDLFLKILWNSTCFLDAIPDTIPNIAAIIPMIVEDVPISINILSLYSPIKQCIAQTIPEYNNKLFNLPDLKMNLNDVFISFKYSFTVVVSSFFVLSSSSINYNDKIHANTENIIDNIIGRYGLIA